MKTLGPALGVGLLLLLVGALIALNDAPSAPTNAKSNSGDSTSSVPKNADASDMSGSLPPLDSPEWKPAAGGMRVWDAKEGSGEPCKPGATVTIHYTGWLKNGEVFDSSVRRGETIDFPLATLIKGWQEGIPGMKPGGIRRLEIPPEWAYGSQDRPGIPANSTLVFEVKLFASK